ncbi:helix-turn-helix domain-containing protein [Glycomyces paridis]|uniref:helix-turn-helix domain-containing protein n=1 Tax=Glycomyces paridis TaxID=2126555 RepID=UPI0013051D80|nr:helix-turn-helix transcriptional regulator [Glycomyces paridis]
MTDEDSIQDGPGEVPSLRNPAFKDWVERSVTELQRLHGWTKAEVARRGGLSRQQVNRWRGIGGPQSLPEAETLIVFCRSLDLDLAEPYRILGWDAATPTAGGRRPAPHPVADHELRMKMQRVRFLLEDPYLDDDDRALLEHMMDTLIVQLEVRVARRREAVERDGTRSAGG